MSTTELGLPSPGTSARLPKSAMPAPSVTPSAFATCLSPVIVAGSGAAAMGAQYSGTFGPVAGCVSVGQPKAGWGSFSWSGHKEPGCVSSPLVDGSALCALRTPAGLTQPARIGAAA